MKILMLNMEPLDKSILGLKANKSSYVILTGEAEKH